MTKNEITSALVALGVNKYIIDFDCTDYLSGETGCHIRFDDMPRDSAASRKLVKASGAEVTDKGIWFPIR